ncbi:nucleotidyltransferase domain-containing protein [Paenibacillus sp. MMS18-CY102]|uniref:nucleotidyltransferase domain-containing protein n=1 Tax=Paenibacillus sp. MMS18-CY102 TaxID=2682849 RepID=UPI0013667C40|nr:nucleotidyltransferase family protein [Paenibacillus sp. MMS18-CY102]MWC30420.1 hypothetical protein [Paenibacillus sp. MMS18-CY102]
MDTSPIIALLNRIYEGQRPLFGDVPELEEVWQDVERFQFFSQLYHLIRSKELHEELPEWFMKELKLRADAILFQNMLIRGEMNKLLRVFDKAGIDVIVLKGIRLAEQYFGHFAARPTTDVDLLVRPDRLEEAHALLEREGFCKQDEDDGSHFHFLYNKMFDNVMFPFLGVELHWNILRSHISDTAVDDSWDRALPLRGYQHVKEMAAQDVFYHVCLHGYNHDMLSLKQVHDIVHLVYGIGEQIDYGALFKKAKQDGNYAKVLIVLSLVYRLFPQLQAHKPLPKTRHWPFWSMQLVRDMAQGQKKWRYYMFRLMSVAVSYDSNKHRLAHLRYMLLPPRDFAMNQLKEGQSPSLAVVYARIYRNRMRLLLKLSPAKEKSRSRTQL